MVQITLINGTETLDYKDTQRLEQSIFNQIMKLQYTH